MKHNLETNTGFHELEMFVLDVLRHDIEQPDSILNLLNNTGCIGWRHRWPKDFTIDVLLPAIQILFDEELVDALELKPGATELTPILPLEERSLATPEELWFLLTDKGKAVWDNWEP